MAAADQQVVVLAPFGRDASVVESILREADLGVDIVGDLAGLLARVRAGAAAVLVTGEGLNAGGVSELSAALADQPAWSDIPVLLLLTDAEGVVPAADRHLAAMRATRNVIVLQRPLAAITLITAVQSALRARLRQYEVRDLITRERQAREQAEAATRIKDEFRATVSHELRTPLRAVLVWAKLLDAGRLTGAQARDAVHAIASGAEAQSQLIEDLLDVSRVLTGKLRLDVERQPIAPIIEAAIAVVRPMADAKGVRLEVELDPSTGPVLVDRERVQQIVWNLLSNAVKFTPPDGRVCIRLAREPGHVRVEVSDDGQGIAPDLLPHVFERFRQGDPAPTRRHGGLGLGLTIVQQLVELHGGSIDASSAGVGMGATFNVRLPAA
jgi:signal transduction histidine kinase